MNFTKKLTNSELIFEIKLSNISKKFNCKTLFNNYMKCKKMCYSL